jgi:hypothetical protein
MALPFLHITNGPAQRDLELAFVGRNLGAEAKFTIFVPDFGPTMFGLRIYNFKHVTCHGPNYKLGGLLGEVNSEHKHHLPPFNFIFVEYNAEKRPGRMEFSNAE